MTRALLLAAVALFTSLAAAALPLMGRMRGKEGALKRMTGIAAGVLLGSGLLVAIPEGFEIGMHDGGLGPMEAGLAVLGGVLVMLILECFGFGHDIHEEHHDHEHQHGHDHVHHPSNASAIVLGLSVHALTDGLAIGAAIASGSLFLTLSIYFAVIAHKIPAAFSVGVFSGHERAEISHAWRDVALFSLATPAMILVTFLALGDVSATGIGIAILFSGGTFLYVATVDVLPDVHHAETGRAALVQVLIGAALIAAILFGLEASGLVGHAH